jgi:multiple sugar transport system ATP-binding protein
MNLAEAELIRRDGSVLIRFGEDQELVVPGDVLAARPALAGFAGRPVVLGIRPEDIEDAVFVDGPRDGRTILSTLDIREDMGSEVFGHFPVAAPPPLVDAVAEALGHEAVAAEAEAARRGRRRFVARLNRSTRAREGERLELVVDTRRLHFFDPANGAGIYT